MPIGNSLEDFRPKTSSDLNEVSLLYRANPLANAFDGRLPSKAELRDMNREFGVEMATAAFFQAVQKSSADGPLNRAVRAMTSSDLTRFREVAGDFEVSVVQSNLFQSGRAWGDHAEIWRRWARELGFKTDEISTDPFVPIATNARAILNHLRLNPHPKRILLTYGQGGAELRMVLEKLATEEVSAVTSHIMPFAWINVCGAVFGASSSLKFIERPFSRLRSKFVLQRAERHALCYSEMSPNFAQWMRPLQLPKSLRTINVVGLPFRSQIPQGLHLSYFELQKIEPNDGAVLLSEALAPSGFTVPILGMSHRAENLLLEPILKRVLALVTDPIQSNN